MSIPEAYGDLDKRGLPLRRVEGQRAPDLPVWPALA